MKRLTLLAALLNAIVSTAAVGAEPVSLRDGEVLAFVGGEFVAIQGETGHLESLLAAGHPGMKLRFRNLGWEGDTVFEQPRDLNFPGLPEQLKRVEATVVFLEFGRAESLAGSTQVGTFVTAYEKLCDTLAKHTPRLVLVTPPPFEKPTSATLPDLSSRNDDLRAYAQAVVDLAKRRGIPCVDVFTELTSRPDRRLTEADGLHPTAPGTAAIARAAARRLGLEAVASKAGDADAQGRWPAAELESLRQAVVAKNRMWFDYWRPMNWAFLGGDRQFTPSSRDPEDLNVRIFPRELEKFVPLIEQADAKITELAKAAGAERK